MNLSRHTKFFWAILLSVFLTNVPHLAWADAVQQQMIPTTMVIGEMTRQQAEANVQEFLARQDVQKELSRQGVSPEEAATRLASLSDQELKQLAHQMDQARAGGDVFTILLIVLVVVLIIYFIRRI
jgi:hypothetical protein